MMEQTVGLVVLLAAILLLAVLLPFTASFLFDTFAAARRGKGLLPPLLVLLACAALLYGGMLLWSTGMQLSSGSPTLAEWAPAAMVRGLVLMLAFSVPLSILTGSLRVWRESAGPLDIEAAQRREARRMRRSHRLMDRRRSAGLLDDVDRQGSDRQDSDLRVPVRSAA